jgi:O-antigen/teichoic acid export membrane protein
MLGNRLNKKIGIYFIGMLSSKILSVLLIPIYAFNVSVDVLGYYDYMHTIMSILIPFIYVAIWESILRFILSEKNENEKKSAIATSAIFTLLISFIFLLGFIIIGQMFISDIKTMILISIMFVSNGLTIIWQYFSRALESNRTFVIAGIFGTIVNFIFVLLLVCILKMGLHGLIISYTLGQLSILFNIERKIQIRLYVKIINFQFNILKRMLLFSLPLVLNLTSMWIMSAFGRFIITTKMGPGANGLYSFASQFSLIVTMLGSVITMAIIEEAIISAKENGIDSKFTKSIEGIFKIFQSIVILAVPLIVIFYSIIQSTDYYNSMKYAPWLLLYAVATTMSSNMGSVFQAINKTKYQFTTTVVGALVTLLVSYGLISFIGIYAIIIGQVIGGIIMLLARYILINKFVEFKINWKPIIGMSILFVLTTLICLNLHYFFSFVVFALVAGILCFINWNYVNSVYKLLKIRLRNHN